MKRLFLIAAAVSFVCGTVMAQEAKFDEAAIIKKIDKLELNTQNPKKATKADTWLALGDAYTEAGTVASTGLYRGMDEFTTKILMQNPEEGTETINGVEYVKYSNAYLDVYLKDMMVQFWRVKRNFVDGALEKGVAAYQKAYELDPKNAEAKVKTGLEKIANSYKETADNYYTEADYAHASDVFAAAYELQKQAPLNKIDTVCCFNAGYLYTFLEKYDLGEKYLSEAIENGYESNGDSYDYLFLCYYKQKNYESAEQTLLAGISKFPQNSAILEHLISLHGEMGKDPNTIIPYIERGIESDPNNAVLWNGLGGVYDKLGENEKAIEAFMKARELDPEGYETNYNYALMVIRMADKKTEEFNKKSFTSTEERDAAMKELDAAYEKAIEPLEKALAKKPQDAVTVELLKSVCFRLRDNSPEMMSKFEKYDAMFKSMQQ